MSLSLQTWLNRGTCWCSTRRHLTSFTTSSVVSAIRSNRRCHYHHTSAPRRHTKTKRDVFTLDPEDHILQQQRPITLTGTNATVQVYFAGHHKRTPQPVQLSYELSGQARIPWPMNSSGLLYYFCPPDRPRISGEIRFRLVNTEVSSSFASGEDIRVSTNEPWHRPLFSLAKNPQTRPLYDLLIEQGLVSPGLVAALDKLPKLSLMYTRCRVLHTLNDPFPIDLAANWHSMVAISEEGVEQINILKQFRDHRMMSAPYEGVMLARFERCQRNPRSVVLRFLEEVQPVVCVVPDYDQYIDRPEAGKLFTKHYHRTRRPWSLNIDDPTKGKLMAGGLRLLWDSAETLRPER